MKVRVVELFSGVGAQRMALTRLMKKHPEIECEFVAQCDIDKFAIKSYNAIWGETPNLGDVSKLEKLPDCDIVTWSYPCQSVSAAGKQEGMVEGSGTRSALCWEVIRLLRNSNRPKWLVMENVPAILFKTHKPEFDRLCANLEELGYHNRYGVLNAVDFDIAQNRKRCFMISCLGEDAPELPTGTGLKHAMKHYLEKEVDQKYFLSKERMKGIVLSTEKEKARGNGFKFEILDTEKVPAKTLNTREGHRKVCNYFMDTPRTLKRAGYVYPDKKSQHYAFYDPSQDGASVCVCVPVTGKTPSR